VYIDISAYIYKVRHMTTYAKFNSRSAWLSTDFGRDMAIRYFGDSVVNEIPRYVRGKRKGLLKGQIEWRKVASGGWVKTGGYDADYGAQGYVETRVNRVIEAKLVEYPWGGGDEKVYGVWELEPQSTPDRHVTLAQITTG